MNYIALPTTHGNDSSPHWWTNNNKIILCIYLITLNVGSIHELGELSPGRGSLPRRGRLVGVRGVRIEDSTQHRQAPAGVGASGGARRRRRMYNWESDTVSRGGEPHGAATWKDDGGGASMERQWGEAKFPCSKWSLTYGCFEGIQCLGSFTSIFHSIIVDDGMHIT